MTISCPTPSCERSFVSERAASIHKTKAHRTDAPWQTRETLAERYHDQEMSIAEIADEFGCATRTVQRWLHKLDIPVRQPAREKPPYYRTKQIGYEQWSTHVDGVTKYVFVHRLVAVAMHGFEALEGKFVHHVNEIPWDNRPENLELMEPGEHTRHHLTRGGSV